MEPNAVEHPDSPSRMVHVGLDDWLFLIHGTNDVLAQYRRDGFPKALLNGWRHLLEERIRLCAAHGTRYFHVVVPEKVAVYDDKLDGLAIPVRLSPAARLRRTLWFSHARRAHIDLLTPFRSHRTRIQLYLKTDTHWTIAGCHLAYMIICGRMGVRPQVHLADPSCRESGLVAGDLGSKFDPPRAETVEGWRYPRFAARVFVNDLLRHFEEQGHVTWGGVGTQVIYRNDRPDVDPRRLVIFGDSFAHHTWLPKVGALAVMMAETFHEVHLIWATAIDWSYIAAIKPDLVLTEIAERFMIQVPPLAVDLAALEMQAIARKIGQGPHGDKSSL